MNPEYHTGDLRACSKQPCLYPVFFNGYDWSHLIPRNRDEPEAFVEHRAYPFPEHKHTLQLKSTDNFWYYFKCQTCNYQFEYSKFYVKRTLRGGKL